MNTLEERVRAATRAAGNTVTPDSVPPLRLPSGDPGRSRGGSRSLASVWARRLAPLAAALAVVALAIAMVTLSRTVRSAAPPSSQRPATASAGLATASPGPVVAGPSLASYVASGLVPAYYVSLESHGHGHPGTNPSDAVVRSTVTGAALGTIAAAGGSTIVAVTAAADDKTFVLDEQPWVPSQGYAKQWAEPRTFIMFRLGASGQPGGLTRLPMSVPSGEVMDGIALSPDGSQLAIAVEPNNVKKDRNLVQIRVYSLRTGAVRTWSADGHIGGGGDDALSLSWTADERTLAFNSGLGGDVGVRLLNLRARGSNLLADSREAERTKIPYGIGWPPPCVGDAVITPDGTRIVCGAETDRQRIESEYLEFSVSTGSVTRILGHWTFPRADAPDVGVLWSNASGSVLIGIIPDGLFGRAGVIRGNEFTPLRTSLSLAAAW